MKRLISFIICMLMLLSLVPAAVYAEDAENAPAYDLPEAGDSVNILGTGKAEEAKIGGSGSKYNIHLDGEGYAHTVKFRKFAENNTKNYDPDIILYCIQFVKLDKSKYEVFKPAKHEYWQGLTEIAREGILLSIGLGYPASTLEELSSDSVTVTADDALAATQTLAWEFELGLRTTFEPFTADEIAAKKDTLFTGNYAGNPNVNGINATPAETAYNKILERIRAFKEEHPNTTLQELEDNPNFVLLAADDAQTLLSYRLPGDSLITWSEKGAIEIHKTDTDGYPLAGAKFEIRDASGNLCKEIGEDGVITTDENGYAFTKKDVLDFGTYYVREIEAPEGYERITAPWTVTIGEDTPTIDGVRKVVIEAVNESVKISLTVNKVWNDANDQDGKRPDSITVKLLADGIEIDSAQLAADDWTHTFDALPKYRDGGIEIAYSVLEVVPDGYTASYDKGEVIVTITNTYTPATTSLTVNKVWNDADDQDGKRPDSITVKLLADGVEIKSAELTADGWAHVFDALPKYRDGGIEIAYSVLEVVPEGYTADYDVAEGVVTITNTYTPATTSLTVNKVWNDADDQDGKRPDSITVKLLADGVEIDSAQLAADGWAHTFDALPKYRDGGIEISYSVLEVVPEGYTADYDVAEGVVTITNTYTPATTSLTVNKVWDDANDQDGKRPDSITVKLLADGVEIDSAQLAADGWAHTFDALPKYRDGGIEIAYSVLEVVPEGYTASYDVGEGVVTITNTYTPETTSLTVNKVWNDANDQDGKRPDSVTVKLLADGVEIKSAELTADGWAHTFDALPKYRDGGIEISYSVIETVPDGYTADYDVAEGVVTITNTYTPATTSLTVNKVWNDANDQDGKRPDSITVKLLAGGVEIDTAQLAADGWSFTFNGLPKYRDGGVEISYSVLEVVPDGYTADYDVAEGVVTITNTYTPATTSLTVNKVWNDANDQDGKRPDSITVKLLADGIEIDTAQLAADGWTHTFDALPKYRDGGIEISYSVLEVVPDGYTASYDVAEGIVTITNTYTPETTSLTVNKVWNDANDQDGKRPDSITVKLLADGVEIKSAELTADGWAHTFDALPKYRDGGIEIAYSVLEVVPEGYTASYDVGEGIVTITNTYTPATTSLTVNKVWNDANDQDGKRPDSITVKLLADGVEIESAELTADGWAHTFAALPKYRDGGIQIAYSVLEVVPNGYTASYDKGEGIVTITNTYTPEITSLTVNKVWNDANDQDGKRPDSVTVKLLADGVEVDSAQLAADGWSFTFNGLPKYRDGGIAILYSVLEVVPDGYTASYDKGEGVVTITNTYTPELTSVNVTKTWYDENDNDNIRPESVTIRLYADGVEIAVCELNAASDWAHLFSELPRYRDGGAEIVYTISEDPVTDYETVYDGYDVFNSHDPYRCDITVNKVWNDEDNVHGLRPDSVTVRLYADGVEIDSAVLSAENGWSVTFDGLLEFAYGSAIVYTISEDDVASYSSRVEGSAEDGFTVVNTVEYVPPTGDGSSLAALGILAALSLAAPLALKRRRRSDA